MVRAEKYQFYCFSDGKRVDATKQIANLPKGAVFIFRDYHLSKAERLNKALELKSLCHKQSKLFYLAKDVDLIPRVKPDGFHVPEFMLTKTPHIKARYPNLAISAAAHSKVAFLKALKNGADIVHVSPVFKTKSHSNKNELGISKFSLVINRNNRNYKKFISALGGINSNNLSRLKNLNIGAIAGISFFSQ